MRLVAVCTLAIWAAVNVLLAGVARTRLLVAAVFGGSALVLSAGLLIGSPYCVAAGLAGSLAGPVLYGALIVRHNYLAHHLARFVLVAALAVLYWLT
jgi:uncharacterized membrane protein YuzA (DUF378 family)